MVQSRDTLLQFQGHCDASPSVATAAAEGSGVGCEVGCSMLTTHVKDGAR